MHPEKFLRTGPGISYRIVSQLTERLEHFSGVDGCLGAQLGRSVVLHFHRDVHAVEVEVIGKPLVVRVVAEKLRQRVVLLVGHAVVTCPTSVQNN